MVEESKKQAIVPASSETLERARHLAKKMACALNDEDVLDVATALAMLTSAVVRNYARDPADAQELVKMVRRIEDRLLAKTTGPSDLSFN